MTFHIIIIIIDYCCIVLYRIVWWYTVVYSILLYILEVLVFNVNVNNLQLLQRIN